jgi:hypothetical protein
LSGKPKLVYNIRAEDLTFFCLPASPGEMDFDKLTTIEAQRMGKSGRKPGVGAALKYSLPKDVGRTPAARTW